MKSYNTLNIVFLIICFLVAKPSSAHEMAKKYAWQQDDTELINNLSDKYVFEPLPVTSFCEQNRASQKSHTRQVTRPISKKNKLTETVRKKKSEIEDFLKQQYTNATLNIFDRESALNTLLSWHPSKFALMLDDPQLDKFIENRLGRNDSKTLHALATLIDKSARKLAERKEVPEELIEKLETKSLKIIAQINTLPHINRLIKTNIDEHLEWMRRYKPHLFLEYQAMCLPQTPLPFLPLNWMPSNNPLSSLEPQKIAQPTSTPAVLLSKSQSTQPDTPLSPAAQPTPITISESTKNAEGETSQEEVERLSRLFVRQFKTQKIQESLQTAWTVIQKAKADTKEYNSAKDHIKKISTKKDYNALCMMAALEKDIDQASAYFIQAQSLRPTKICEHPKIAKPQTTLIFLTGGILPLQFQETDFIQTVRQKLTQAARTNKKAAQAMALYHYKNAGLNSHNQLIVLKGAKEFADLLDPEKDILDSALDLDQFYYDYYQQLHIFSSNENNYSINDSVPLTNIFLATAHSAKSAIELEKLSKKNIHYGLYGIRANAHFNRYMHMIHATFDEIITERIKAASQDHNHIGNLTILLVQGLCGMPLSIEERHKITDFLKSLPECTDPIAVSLRNKSYEKSHYERAALNSNKREAANDYYRMLFAIDSGNNPLALKHAQEAAKASFDFAPHFLKCILMRSELVFKTDAQKLVSIQRNLVDHRQMCTKEKVAFLHSDAIAELEQMRKRKFLPSYPLLISYYCTIAKPESTRTIVTLLEESAASVSSFDDLKQAGILCPSTWQTLHEYCSMNGDTLDPIYRYSQILLDALITSDKLNLVYDFTQAIQKVTEYIKSDVNVVNLESALYKISPEKSQLIEKLETILANKKNVNNLQTKEIHQVILDLYFIFNPEAKFESSNEITDFFYGSLLDQLVPKIVKTKKRGLITTTKKDQAQLNTLSSHTPDSSNSFAFREKIHVFRMNKDFIGYKKLHETKQLNLSETEPNPDPLLKIDGLMVKIGHEYMLAQADSQNPIDPLQVPAINSLIQQAITIHPFYSYHAVATELLNDDVLPKNIEKGTEYLHKAIINGEKHLNKLSTKDIACLNQARKQLQILAIATGVSQSFNSAVNEIRST